MLRNDSAPVYWTAVACVSECRRRSQLPANDAEFAVLRHFYLTHVPVSNAVSIELFAAKLNTITCTNERAQTVSTCFSFFENVFKCFLAFFFFLSFNYASNEWFIAKHIQKHFLHGCVCCGARWCRHRNRWPRSPNFAADRRACETSNKKGNPRIHIYSCNYFQSIASVASDA